MRVALIGNQNSGKTSLFNALTGSNQKVGNWPGVTISRKEGVIKSENITVVDLPGVYSLMPYTEEENISRNYLLNEKPDVVLNVIDSTSLERSLYLTTQLLDFGYKVVLALNMSDLLKIKGIEINEKVLENELGVSAVKTSAKTGEGITELVEILKNQKTQKSTNNIEKYPKIIEKELNNIKLSEKQDNNFQKIECVLGLSGNDLENGSVSHVRQVLGGIYGEDLEQEFANFRYKFIEKVRDKCLIKNANKENNSEKIDKIMLNRWLAVPIFVCIMSLIYFLSVGVVGKFTTELIGNFIEFIKNKILVYLTNLDASNWVVSLVVNGIISGVGSVLSFVPELVVIFLCISILETSGYMSRISFMFDRLFRKFGLSGKSLVPFIIGTGCSVPAISATKTIEQNQEKEMTIVLSPFVPCSAKLPIIALFAGYFFPNNSGLVTAALYFFAIILIMLSALFMKKFFYKNQATSFVSELPEYKKPSVKYIFRDVTEKTKDFIARAGTIILICSVIVWFLSSFSWNLRFCDNIQNSVLAKLGDLFSWFFYPIVGVRNWAVSVSAIQGLIAKEQVVSSMNIIAGVSGSTGSVFESEIFSFFNKSNSLAFMVFNLFSAPCVASIGAMKNELKSTKKVCFALLFQISIAWICAVMVNLIGGII